MAGAKKYKRENPTTKEKLGQLGEAAIQGFKGLIPGMENNTDRALKDKPRKKTNGKTGS